MRNSMRMVVAVVSLAISTWACALEGPRDRVAGDRRPEHTASYFGDVLLRSDGVRIFVMVDTTLDRSVPSDGLVDQWFILETAEPIIPAISAHLPGALLVHTPDTLRVSSPEQRFELVLSNDARKAPLDGTLTTRVVGIGLSRNVAESTNLRIADHVRAGRVTSTCEACDVLNPDPGSGGSAASCGSGGDGATQCSASYGSNSCSISCSSGYYACCNALPGSASCRCVRQ